MTPCACPGAVGLTLSGFSRSRMITLRLTVGSSRSRITWMCFFTCACKVRHQHGVAQHGSFKGWWHRDGEMGMIQSWSQSEAMCSSRNMGFGISVQLSPVQLPGKVHT